MFLKRRILALTLAPILTILTPLIYVVLVPFNLYRSLVLKWAKMFRPDLTEMLSVFGNSFAMEFPKMFQKHMRCAIVAAHKIEGHMDLIEFRKIVLENVVQRKCDGGRNGLLYPELRQTIVSFGGYLFWKWDSNFRIEHHVKNYGIQSASVNPPQNKNDGDSLMSQILHDFRCRPFCGGRSPWEILVWNYKNKNYTHQSESIVLIRCHHSLADGHSLLQMLLEDILGGKMAASCPKPRAAATIDGKQMTPKQRQLAYPYTNIYWDLFFHSYEILKFVFQTWDINEWHLPEKKLSTKFNSAMSKRIPIEKFRAIMTKHGCTFNAVIASGFSGALRKLMLQMDLKLPPVLHSQVVLGLPNRPSTLSNHLMAVMAPLPIGIDDPIARIRIVHKSLTELRDSDIAWTIFCLRLLLRPCPAKMIRILGKNTLTMCLLSNFPGPMSQVYYKNYAVTDIMYSLCHLVGNIGIGVGTLSYNGGVRIDISVNEAILPEQKFVEHLLNYLLDELESLR